jgi:hypothetical protein
VTGECSDGHCVVARVLTLRGADVGMRVDLQDRQIVGVPTSELGERRHAHGALAAEGRDPRRVVLADDLQGGCELFENDGLGFYTVACLKAGV